MAEITNTIVTYTAELTPNRTVTQLLNIPIPSTLPEMVTVRIPGNFAARTWSHPVTPVAHIVVDIGGPRPFFDRQAHFPSLQFNY